MVIRTQELRQICEALLAYAEGAGKASITIDADHYWNLPEDKIYDAEAPSEIEVGQLEFDWERLNQIREGSMPAVGYAFVWLAAIFRAIGPKIDSPEGIEPS